MHSMSTDETTATAGGGGEAVAPAASAPAPEAAPAPAPVAEAASEDAGAPHRRGSSLAGGWFANISNALGTDVGTALANLKQQAERVAEDATPALGAALDAVKTQAAKLKEEAVQAAQALQHAAEQANNEILAEQERVKATADPHRWADHLIAILPWEAEDESKSILCQPLMERVLALSLDEGSFAPLKEEERAQYPFKLENHVDIVVHLLELDPNLAKMHAKLGARMAEDEFWRAYFYRCACLRAEIGMASGDGGSYAIIGEPLLTPFASSSSSAAAAQKQEPSSSAQGDRPSPSRRSSAPAASSSSSSSSSSSASQKQQQQQSPPAAPSSSPSPPGKTGGGEGKTDDGAAPSEEGKKQEGEEGEEEGVDADDIDLDGLDLGSDDGEALLEGDALKELEAQIAAELDEEDLGI